MTEQERAELKAELMKEIEERLASEQIIKQSTTVFQPIIDKWYHGGDGDNMSGVFVELFPSYKAWDTWEHVRRITCNILKVSYVRNIKNVDKARKIADRLCEVIVELAKEV